MESDGVVGFQGSNPAGSSKGDGCTSPRRKRAREAGEDEEPAPAKRMPQAIKGSPGMVVLLPDESEPVLKTRNRRSGTTIPVAAPLLPPSIAGFSLKADNAIAFHQQIWGRGPREQFRSGRTGMVVLLPGEPVRLKTLRRRRFLVFSRLTGSLSSGRSTTIPVAASIASGTTPPGPSPGCFLESRQRRRFPSAKMGTGSPGRAVPIRAIYRYGAWGELEASASPAPVPRLLPSHGLAFVGEKYNHPRCCFHRLRDSPPLPSPGCFLESRQRRRFPSATMRTWSCPPS